MKNNYLIKTLASGFGVGFIPFASGTFGSLLGIPLYFVFVQMTFPIRILSIVSFTFLAIYIAHMAEKDFAEKDSHKIVIDEIAGMQWALLFASFTITNIVFAFFLFRFFDISKMFPANYCEKKMTGGVSIVADDVVAGIYSGICLLIINIFIRG